LWAIVGILAPIIVAVTGYLATIEVADRTAALSDRHAERLFHTQRAAEIVDRRQELYVAYLATVDAQYRAPAPTEGATYPPQTVLKLNDADAMVRLVATGRVRVAAERLTYGAIEGRSKDTGEPLREEAFLRLKEVFIQHAQEEQRAAEER
jgi:hypothetical protein